MQKHTNHRFNRCLSLNFLSAFAGIIEPYEGRSNLLEIRRLPLAAPDGAPLPDTSVGIEIQREDGKRDICILTAPETGAEALEPANGVHVCGALAFITFGLDGPERLVLCQGARLEAGPVSLTMRQPTEFVELAFDARGAKVVSGDPADIETLAQAGNELPIRPH